MKKWIKRVAIALLIIIVGVIIIVLWIFNEAFGPKERTITIKNTNGSTLICNENYTADMAAVFYDVDFTLKKENGGTVFLGTVTFNDDDWQKNVRYRNYSDWHLLYANSKLLMINPKINKRQDTLFSPLELRYDSLWKQAHNDIPSWPYSGSSNIDTIIGQSLKVSYHYRIGDYPPFKFYSQTLEYKLDTVTGQIRTLKIFERKETKNGS